MNSPTQGLVESFRFRKTGKSDIFLLHDRQIKGRLMHQSRTSRVAMSPFVNWMFIGSYESFLEESYCKTDRQFQASLVQLEYSGFDGATVPVCTFGSLTKCSVFVQTLPGLTVREVTYDDFRGREIKVQSNHHLEAIADPECRIVPGSTELALRNNLGKIPGAPIAYWVTSEVRKAFDQKIARA